MGRPVKLTKEQRKENKRKQSRDWYQKNKASVIAKNKAFLEKQGQPYKLWANARHRAKVKGLACDLAIEDIVIPAVCPVLGIPLVRNKRGYFDNSPSIDRIDNTKGYTKDNIVIVSNRVNMIKNNASVEELAKIYAFYSRFGA